MVKLFCTAHYGEAQSFLTAANFKKSVLPSLSDLDLFEHAQTGDLLLITGEGPLLAGPTLAAVLGLYPQIDLIINGGVAGALDSRLPLRETYLVRTTYLDPYPYQGATPKTFVLKSACLTQFPFLETWPQKDCLTSHLRVTEDALAQRLRAFAHLVDRELWALEQVAHLFKKPLVAFKLTVDYAGADACRPQMRETFGEYALLLAQKFQLFLDPSHLSAEGSNISPWEFLTRDPSFHFTHAQEQLLQKKCSKLSVMSQSSLQQLSPLITILKTQTLLPKERTKKLLKEIDDLLYPWKKQLAIKAAEILTPFDKYHVPYQYDPQWEKKDLHLHPVIRSERSLTHFQLALKEFDLAAWEKLFSEGEL